jgi:hypothetical protein
MFAHFSLPNVADVARRTLSMTLVVGFAALVACVSFGQIWLGVGACIGLGLGTLNFRMIGISVNKVAASEVTNKRRPLALNTLARMGIITVVTIGLLLLNSKLGFGILGGLAVFQVILLANVARSMAKSGPITSVDDLLNANVVDDNIARSESRPVIGSSDDTSGGA